MSKRYRVRVYQGYTDFFWIAERKGFFGWRKIKDVCLDRSEAVRAVELYRETYKVEYID